MKTSQLLTDLLSPRVSVGENGVINAATPLGAAPICAVEGSILSPEGVFLSQEKGPYFARKYMYYTRNGHISRMYKISGINTGSAVYGAQVSLEEEGVTEEEVFYATQRSSSTNLPIVGATSTCARALEATFKLSTNSREYIKVSIVSLTSSSSFSGVKLRITDAHKLVVEEGDVLASLQYSFHEGSSASDYNINNAKIGLYEYDPTNAKKDRLIVIENGGVVKRVRRLSGGHWQTEAEIASGDVQYAGGFSGHSTITSFNDAGDKIYETEVTR